MPQYVFTSDIQTLHNCQHKMCWREAEIAKNIVTRQSENLSYFPKQFLLVICPSTLLRPTFRLYIVDNTRCAERELRLPNKIYPNKNIFFYIFSRTTFFVIYLSTFLRPTFRLYIVAYTRCSEGMLKLPNKIRTRKSENFSFYFKTIFVCYLTWSSALLFSKNIFDFFAKIS